MRDSYYYRSLIATFLLYIAALSIVVGVIYITGTIGLVVLLLIIIGCLCYFYGIFEKSEERVKGNNKF